MKKLKRKFKYAPLRKGIKKLILRQNAHHIKNGTFKPINYESNPTIYTNLPDGKYLIRGNSKSKNKQYRVIDNNWELTDENLSKSWIKFHYNLYPSLKHQDYVELNKHFYKLKKHWQENTFAYMFKEKLRRNREIKRTMLRIKKREKFESSNLSTRVKL